MVGETDNYLEMKPIEVFDIKDFEKAKEAWEKCEYKFKEIVETVYG